MANGPTFEAGAGWGAWVKDNLVYLIPALAVIVLILVLIFSGSDSPDTASTPSTSTTPSATQLPAGTVSQTVVVRDSYTSVARRAITAYVGTSPASETAGQRLYAETVLQSKIKAQSLMAGGLITFQTAQIAQILDDYSRLTPGQRTKWESMARNVKF